MIKANVKFYGSGQGSFGMPEPYHSYMVYSSPWQLQNSGVASVMGVSSNTPTPESPHVISEKDGEEGAYNLMLDRLRKLPANQGLSELIHREP
jgi:hypothetical protein